MNNGNIRVGIIGAGDVVGKLHLPGLRAQKGVEVFGLANRSMESSQAAADRFEIPRTYENWSELLDDDRIDAVVIGTWPYMHRTMTLAALDAGKHVFTAPRMAMNASEAHEMLAASQAFPDLITQVGPPPHFAAIEPYLIEILRDGYVGDVINVRLHAADSVDFPDSNIPLHWRQDRDVSGNNIMHLGIWYENLMRLVGTASTVQALGQTLVRQRLDHQGERVQITIPDHLEVLCNLAGGGTLNLTMTAASGFAERFDFWIHGSDGTLRIQPGGGFGQWRITGGRRGDSQMSEITIPEEKVGRWRVEEQFINAIRGLEPVTRTSFTDGVKYMEFTDAVAEARQTGAMIHLPS